MKKIFGEFKDFISRGNVMDMAVGVIIGGAFTAIVNSLVLDLLNPILGLITGGMMDFSDLTIPLGGTSINYGAFPCTAKKSGRRSRKRRRKNSRGFAPTAEARLRRTPRAARTALPSWMLDSAF